MHPTDHRPPGVEVPFKPLQRWHHSRVGRPDLATDREKVGDGPVPKHLEVTQVVVVDRFDQQPVRIVEFEMSFEQITRLPKTERIRNLSGRALSTRDAPDPEHRDRDHEETEEIVHRVTLHFVAPGGETVRIGRENTPRTSPAAGAS